MTTRRGFTLVELLIALVLMVVVGGLVYTMLIRTQRMSRQQAEQSNLQENVRAGAAILPAELREVGYDGTAGADLLLFEAKHIQFRAMRGIGFTCDFTTSDLRIRRPMIEYGRAVKVTDRMLVFIEYRENEAADDQWITKDISAIDFNSTCPDGRPAIKLTFASAGFPTADAVLGGPVRFFEVMDMALYDADGRSWLGAKSISAGDVSYQPVLGPLNPDSGVVFTYYNSANNVVPVGGDVNTIRAVRIDFHGQSEERVSGTSGGPRTATLDLRTRVALRNTLRP